MVDLSQKLEGVVIDEVCTLRPNDEVNAPRKSVTLHFDFSACTIAEALERAVSPVRIGFQNANRKNFEELDAEYTIQVSPLGKRITIDSETKLIMQFSKLSRERQEEVLKALSNAKTTY